MRVYELNDNFFFEVLIAYEDAGVADSSDFAVRRDK